jgi:carbonic anhydrase/acetyltransferase-like protein (isoleucine patch superfamily)
MNFDDRISRFYSAVPRLHPTSFVAAGAVILGVVTLEPSVWFQTVLRADLNSIVGGWKRPLLEASFSFVNPQVTLSRAR